VIALYPAIARVEGCCIQKKQPT